LWRSSNGRGTGTPGENGGVKPPLQGKTENRPMEARVLWGKGLRMAGIKDQRYT